MQKNRLVGIGILNYKNPYETARLVRSILSSTPYDDYKILIYDNTDSGLTLYQHWYGRMAKLLPQVSLLHDGVNIGCAKARNVLANYFLRMYPQMEHMVILDQDIVVRPGWLQDMLEVMDAHEDAGQVIWPCFNMANVKPDVKGRLHNVAGGASMHRLASVVDVGGWDSRFFFYRFDSWFTLQSYAKGWPTYMVTKYGEPNEDWSTWFARHNNRVCVECGPISHICPSRGTGRHPQRDQIRRESQLLFESLLKEHGLEDLYLNFPNHTKLPNEKE